MRRGAGVLLPVASLPSPYGVGDLGPKAYEFVDFLVEAGLTYWQILPLGPTDPALDNSPYHSPSAFAGNPCLLSPELLLKEGLLEKEDLKEVPPFGEGSADYEGAWRLRRELLKKAWHAFKGSKDWRWEAFTADNEEWLWPFCAYRALKAHFGGSPWYCWPEPFRHPTEEVVLWARENLREAFEKEAFLQFLFFRQWTALKEYCRQKGVTLIGDVPIYVPHDSADVWFHQGIFQLDPLGMPLAVSGVPPDYFSDTGQRWGSPLYRWEALKEDRYRWWVMRLRHNLKLFDLVRLDHFRGFVAYWAIEPDCPDARRGRWVEAPAVDFFGELERHFPHLPFIAEDLGVITPDVREVMARFGFPGMKVLLFAFGDDFPRGPYLPHNYPPRCLAYTGTHDTNTLLGWFQEEATPEQRERVYKYIGRKVSPEMVSQELIRILYASVAEVVIVPIQDFLGLGSSARINRPSTSKGNWRWRLRPSDLGDGLSPWLKDLVWTYGRI